MSNFRPIKTTCWERFLTSKGCKFKSKEASHDKWRCPGCIKSIIFRGAEKEIPFFHIQNDLRTMGVNKNEFLQWVLVTVKLRGLVAPGKGMYHKNDFEDKCILMSPLKTM